eukprot:PhF_6_TR6038/c0_g3_i3/m.8725
MFFAFLLHNCFLLIVLIVLFHSTGGGGALPLVPITPQTEYVPTTVFYNESRRTTAINVQGDIQGTVLFAQNQIMMTANTTRLVSLRPTLVMFQCVPLQSGVDPTYRVDMEVYNRAGTLVASVPMEHPNDIPKQYPYGVYNLSFVTTLKSGHQVNENNDAVKLSDPAAPYLTSLLQSNDVSVSLRDGCWTSPIYFPFNLAYHRRKVLIITTAVWNSDIVYAISRTKNKTITVEQQTICFVNVMGAWVSPRDVINRHTSYIFAGNMWSATIPRQHVVPGLTLKFVQGNKIGTLATSLYVSSETELLINTISIGLMSPSRPSISFATDVKTQRQYYQTLPVSRVIVSPYESITFTDVVLPSGVKFTDTLLNYDPSNAGLHQGD